jgi:hypothetical protein
MNRQLAISAGLALALTAVAGVAQETSARTVQYHSQDIVPIRAELQGSGALSKDSHTMTVLTQRSELTSADRNWAALYQPADVLYYTRGSRELGIERGTYATVISTDPKANQLTVQREDGQQVTYDPKRLHGIAAYREISRDFSEGDRLQFTVSKPDMDIKNRDLGTVERIDGTSMIVRMDGRACRIRAL